MHLGEYKYFVTIENCPIRHMQFSLLALILTLQGPRLASALPLIPFATIPGQVSVLTEVATTSP